MNERMTKIGAMPLAVVERPIKTLKPCANNPRTHSAKQIRQISESLKQFGWTNPVLVDADGGIIAGHGRVEAAKLLGMTDVPTIRLEHMSEAEKRAYVLADNKLAENAGWDRELLAIELQGLLEMDLDFEVTATGFEMGEIDFIIGESEVNARCADDVDDVPEIDSSAPVVSMVGDLWQVGRHRLLCGDALKRDSYELLLDGEKAEMVFTDPPYNVPIDGHVCGLGSVKHAEFAMASGEMSEDEFVAFLKSVLGYLSEYSKDGSLHFVCMDWRHIYDLLTAGRVVYDELKNICVWSKTNGGMGSLYRSQHELIALFKAGKAAHVNNVALGKHGRNRTNVWEYAGVNSFGAAREADLAAHPTVKPVAMVEDAILDCSNRGGVVLDAFMGSGTTLLAAERTGRCAYGLELEPKYVDVALRRFREMTGEEPVDVLTGATFGELEARSRSK